MPLELRQLKSPVVEVELVTAWGETLIFPMQPLSWHAWNECVEDLIDPLPPKKPNGEPDLNARSYLEAKAKVEEQRQYRRLFLALQGGGNFTDLTGDIDDQIDQFRAVVDTGIALALLNVLIRMAAGARATIAPDRFQRVSANGHADTDPARS